MEFKQATEYFILGVMSGTSVDGIDLAYIRFKKENHWRFTILNAETYAYTREWETKLREAIHFSKEDLDALDTSYTQYLAEKISKFINQHQIDTLDAIASHGHTILHEPARGFTYQIGNQQQLAKLTGQRVICDFRVQDVALGGQGAPLVPVGDQYLFSAYEACVNIGGFSNISYDATGGRLAYDICPTNIVLNRYAAMLGLDYDAEGKIAKEHRIDQELLNQLNALPFYTKEPPKSLGLEWVEQEVFPLLKASGLEAGPILATYTEHMAVQIAAVLNRLEEKAPKVLFTGGGTYNSHFINRLKALSKAHIIIPEDDLINYKEALIFAFMGVLRLRNTNNVLKSVTGSSKDHCSGLIFIP